MNLADVVRNQPDAFAPKHRWAMDWYYPVLAGVLTGAAAPASGWPSRWDTFVMDGLGVRCVSNEPWVTAAETSECALAHLAAGDRRDGAAAAVVDAPPPPRRRLVLDGHRLPGADQLPGRRAHRLHRRRRHPRRRRPQRRLAGQRPLPGRGPAPRVRRRGLDELDELTVRPARRLREPFGRPTPASLDVPLARVRAWRRQRVEAAQDPQRAGGRHLGEATTGQGREVDLLVRRTTAVGRVGEHVVDGQQRHPGRRAASSRRSRPGPARHRGHRR